MDKVLAFLDKFHWKNVLVTIIGVGGAGFLMEADKWQFFKDHPGYFMIVASVVGLCVKAYKHDPQGLDPEFKEVLKRELPTDTKDQLGL